MFPVITITIDDEERKLFLPDEYILMVKVVKTNGNGWGSIKKHGID